jgi:hypothetical protein
MPILARPPRILSETDRATGTLPVAIRGGPALAARVGGLPGVAVVAEAAEAAVLIAEAPVPEAEAPVLVVHQSDEMLAGMDNWNKSTHGKSGLIDKVRASVLTEQQAEQQMLAFLQQHHVMTLATQGAAAAAGRPWRGGGPRGGPGRRSGRGVGPAG